MGKIDPKCCRSTAVVGEVLHFVYSGEFRGHLGADGRLLWQLLCLCVQCSLPEVLRRHTAVALLRSLERPENIVVVPVMLRAVRTLGLSLPERRYLVYRFLNSDKALIAAGDERRRVQSVKAALVELEAIFIEK